MSSSSRQGVRELETLLLRIDGRGYNAYKELCPRDGERGYSLDDVQLFIDHVQGDPFAAPSRLRLRISQELAQWPESLFASPVRRMALEDWLARRVARVARRVVHGERGSGKSGFVGIDAGRQEVLERNAALAREDFVEARLQVGLPAAGRRVLGREACALLLEELPEIAREALYRSAEAEAEARAFVCTVENHAALQQQLEAAGLVAFVADGALLPRESGASDRPLRKGGIPFRAPESLRVVLEVPNPIAPAFGGETPTQRLSGLGLPPGVTLIVGGGYHGKSTLLRALERGVYPHVPGDGREGVATQVSAVKIRAEDGRRVTGCDISGFIGELPQGRSTTCFESDDASGSTSQAANIVEAIEVGATLLLLDEDTSATNFMVRDARMQALVAKEHEPITPFVDRVRELYSRLGVSTILVMGGCGDYFEVADTVIEMRDYLPRDVTAAARSIATQGGSARQHEAAAPLQPVPARIPLARSIDSSRGRREVRIEARQIDQLGFGNERIDLRALEQLVDPSQTRAIGFALVHARDTWMRDDASLAEILAHLDALLDAKGLDTLDRRPNSFARPRPQEIAAALNRLRSLRMTQKREKRGRS